MNTISFSRVFWVALTASNIIFTEGTGLCKFARMFPNTNNNSCSSGGRKQIAKTPDNTSQQFLGIVKSTPGTTITVANPTVPSPVVTTTASQECPLQLDVNTSQDYQFLENPIGEGLIEFEVKASNDLNIALSSNKNNYALYEIVIGGWVNSGSAIRACGDCSNRVRVQTEGYLNANEFRRFWISYGSNRTIAVGRDHEKTPFMEWTHYAGTFEVNYLGYATEGSSGQIKFCSLPQ